MRFLHTADWQLGMTRRFLGAAAQARFTDDRLAAVRDALELARREGCVFAVVSGDVFETNHVDRQTVVRALDMLGAAKVPVFLLPGNHDPLDAGSVWLQRTFRERRPPNVTVLDSTLPIEAAPGVELVGAPWPTKRPLRDLVAAACRDLAPSTGALRVMVGHGCVDTLSPERDDAAAISLASAETAIREGRIHYLALGDRHSLTDVGETGRIRYAGAPEATDYDEKAPGHVLVVDLDADSCRVTPHRVGRWTFLLHEADLAGDTDVDQVEALLGALAAKDRMIVKLTLRGVLTLRQQARLDDILAHARDLLGALEEWERHTDLVVRPDDDDFSDLGLSGFAQTASERLRALAAADGAEAVAARDALGLLVRLARLAE